MWAGLCIPVCMCAHSHLIQNVNMNSWYGSLEQKRKKYINQTKQEVRKRRQSQFYDVSGCSVSSADVQISFFSSFLCVNSVSFLDDVLYCVVGPLRYRVCSYIVDFRHTAPGTHLKDFCLSYTVILSIFLLTFMFTLFNTLYLFII